MSLTCNDGRHVTSDMTPPPFRGVSLSLSSARVSRKEKSSPDEPRCPHCGEDRLIDLDRLRQLFWCHVCGKSWDAVGVGRQHDKALYVMESRP